MKQIKLDGWNEDYSTNVKHGLPENGESVYFKTESGMIVEGFYDRGFDSSQEDWDINDDAAFWHPIKVDE